MGQLDQPPDVGYASLLRLRQVVERRTGRHDAHRKTFKTESLQRVRFKVSQKTFFGEVRGENPILEPGYDRARLVDSTL